VARLREKPHPSAKETPMLKKLLVLALAASGLAIAAPSASACHMINPTNPRCYQHCGYNSVAQETATGGQDTFTGAAYGYALFEDTSAHTVRCYVTVDGVEQATTPTGSGTTFVTTAGTVTYNAAEGSAVALCTEIDGETVECGAAVEIQIPPQEVIDALDTVFTAIDDAIRPVEELLDTVICPLLASVSPGIPGVVDINAEGDTTLAVVGPFWDCPPYGNLFPPA
jgi:hypothetical protein